MTIHMNQQNGLTLEVKPKCFLIKVVNLPFEIRFT
jgi:hypothetical protein